MTAFPVVDVALEGFRLPRERPGTVLVWGAVLVAGKALTTAVLATSGAGEGMAAFARAGGAPGADPAGVAALLPGAAPGLLLSAGVGVLTATLIYAALLRAVLRPTERRAAFLRVGPDELRLLLVLVGLLALAGLGAVVLVVALAMLILPLAAAAGYALSAGTPLVMALAVAILSYPTVRLSLAPSATMAEARPAPFGGWPLTRGAFWPLMASSLMAAGLAAVVFVTAEVLVTCLWALGSGVGMEAAARALQPGQSDVAAALTPGSVVAVLAEGLVSAFALVVAAAPGAAAYRVLSRRP